MRPRHPQNHDRSLLVQHQGGSGRDPRLLAEQSRGSDHEVTDTREGVEAYYARQRAAMAKAEGSISEVA